MIDFLLRRLLVDQSGLDMSSVKMTLVQVPLRTSVYRVSTTPGNLLEFTGPGNFCVR